jgi:hypothetical protein
MSYIAREIEHGFLTNSNNLLGRMTFDDWKELRPIWEAQIDDDAYKVVHTLAKVAWWHGTLDLLIQAPDMNEAGPDAKNI